MEKTIRCTVCSWRGPWEIAESAPRIRAAALNTVAMSELQSAYAEQQAISAMAGAHAPPPCPMCGHHTVSVKLHGYRSVG